MQAFDHSLMRRGALLSEQQRESLILPVSKVEIDYALNIIHVDSTPGCDGYNYYFFKKVWHFIKDDIYMVVAYFFKGMVYMQL